MKNKKLMVIGIDGVPFELIDKYTKQNIMPNLKKAVEKFGLKKLRVPLPEISSVSWTSFMTGVNPGEHGVFGFMELNKNTYSYRFPTFKSFSEKTIWERIEKLGKRSIIINLPNTYPARKMNGILISGFFALDLKNAVYPKTILPHLEQVDYQVDVETKYALNEKKLFFAELKNILLKRFELYKKYKTQVWDLYFFIITGTDRLHHFFFNSWDMADSEHYAEFVEYYKLVDRIIGAIIDDIEKEGIPYLILSDHGFEKIKYEVYLSQYLKEWAFMDFTSENPKNLKSLSENSKAFILDPSRIYIHLKNKYKRGSVELTEYEALCSDLKERLMLIEIEGEKAIKNVFYKEELYSGKYLKDAPDLVVLGNNGFDIKAGITKNEKYEKTHFQGKHQWDNAIVIDSFGLDIGNDPYIYTLGNKIYDYFIK